MGTVHIMIGVGHPGGGDLEMIPEALVDTGATHTMLPESLLAYLHIEPREYEKWELADGGIKELGFGMARLSIEGRDWTCPVIFGPEDQYLVGATTLQIFSLMVDPEGEGLIRRTYRARYI
jgi:predicted aspartyl protease